MKNFTYLLTLFLILSGLTAAAQDLAPNHSATIPKGAKKTFQIHGKVLDSVSHAPLVSATVYIRKLHDSTDVVAIAFTDEKGSFVLKDVPGEEPLRFMIFYTGYRRYIRELKRIGKDTILMGNIYLATNTHMLKGVTVTGEQPPIAINGDTVQFNASSFKTRPNSVLADLLKKLPGVEVAQDGTITAMGKKVDKILVNGKKFFGDDPLIALQNLPSAIVDKVQVTDTKTHQEELTGEPAGGETKTINITLKKGMDHGFFGRAYAGYGTGKHYDASMLLNYFNGSRQISLLGAANNINQIGFTMQDIAKMMGNNIRSLSINAMTGAFGVNGMQFGGGGVGLKRSSTAGINYNDDFGKHLSVNGSYFYSQVLNDNETKTARQNILPDSLFYYNSDNTGHSNNLSHRVNATINYHDSLWRIYYEPSVSITNDRGTSYGLASSTGAKGQIVNQSNNAYTNNDQATSFNNSLNIYRTFRKKGQYFSLNLYAGNDSNAGNDYNSYRNLFYDGSSQSDSVNQFINNQAANNNYSANITYQQPFTKYISLNIAYQLQWQYGLTNKKTYDYNDITGKYSEQDSIYSNKFRSSSVTQSPGVGLNFSLDSGNLTIIPGATFNFIGLHHYSFTHHAGYNQDQFFISPSLYIRKQSKTKGNFNLRYNTEIKQPDISQLLPVADNSNPLYIIEGNPNLKPTISHNFNLGYDYYDFKSGNGIFGNVGYHLTKNGIVNVTTYDPQLRQLTTYTNVNGNYGFNGYLNLNKSKKKTDYHWRMDAGVFANSNSARAFINGVQYKTNNYSFFPHLSFTYGYKELFEITPAYHINYQYATYSLYSLRNTQSLMQQAGFSGSLYWPGRFTWSTNFNYTRNNNVAPGFRKGYLLWNGSVGLDLFKSRPATLQLSVYDLLNQNVSVNRTVGATYTQDTQTIILHRYFMLKFIYNLRKFGEKKKHETHGPFFFF